MVARSREVWAVLGLVAIVAVFVILLRLGAPARPLAGKHPIRIDPETGEKYIEIGGVRRPATDVMESTPNASAPSSDAERYEALVGRAPIVPRNANPMVASVAEALRTGEHQERLSLLADPKPFDHEEYLRNPQAYLNVMEPGRVWQPAQPGPDVPRLRTLTARTISLPQQETVSFKVRAIPQAPVTFTTLDLGEFQNQLPSITVAADEEGVAVARFTATTGTVDAIHILAASPMTSGQLQFTVEVVLPQTAAASARQN
jgi:hypothetical protein